MTTGSHVRRPRQFPIRAEGITPRRLRLVVAVGIYGGALGGAALLVNFLARTDPPKVPQHMPVDATALLSGGAALVCATLAGLMMLWMSNPQERERARGPIVWLLVGFGFGVLSPVFTGAVLPLSTMFLGMIHNDLEVSGILIHTVSSLLQAPSFAFTHGVFGLFTGFMAGVLFAVGGWLIDAAAHSFKRSVSTYAPIAIAVSLGVLLYGTAVFGPPETLARFG